MNYLVIISLLTGTVIIEPPVEEPQEVVSFGLGLTKQEIALHQCTITHERLYALDRDWIIHIYLQY